ncbi:MAG: hypothetical protein K2P90_02890, partial [Holosporales bacterium]|nr:hypothetical protein [Holosporales bacterium]
NAQARRAEEEALEGVQFLFQAEEAAGLEREREAQEPRAAVIETSAPQPAPRPNAQARRAEEEARLEKEREAQERRAEAAAPQPVAAEKEIPARMLRVKRKLKHDDKFDISPLKQAHDETGDFHPLTKAKTRLSECNVALSRQQETGRKNKFYFHPKFEGSKLSIIRKISNSLIKNNPESESDLPKNNARPIENDVYVPADKNKKIFQVPRDHENPGQITSIGIHDQKISALDKISVFFKEKVEERSLSPNEYSDIFKEALTEIQNVQNALRMNPPEGSPPQEEMDGVEAEKVGQAQRVAAEKSRLPLIKEEESASEESASEESASEESESGESEEELEWDAKYDFLDGSGSQEEDLISESVSRPASTDLNISAIFNENGIDQTDPSLQNNVNENEIDQTDPSLQNNVQETTTDDELESTVVMSESSTPAEPLSEKVVIESSILPDTPITS